MGCHFLLQCLKVKSESEVAQSCPTLSDPMDRSLLGSSVHGIFQEKVLEWGAIAFRPAGFNFGSPTGVGEIETSLLKGCTQNLTHTRTQGEKQSFDRSLSKTYLSPLERLPGRRGWLWVTLRP